MLTLNNANLILPGSNKSLLKNISLKINTGELTIIQGKNGSGKTSLIKGLLNLEFKLTGYQKTFKNFFYLPQMENKDFLLPITVKDIAQTSFLLSETELDTPWNKASGGQRKKALLTKALDSQNEIYFLDEPFNHLDVNTIKKVTTKIKKLLKENKAVVMVSHLEPEIDDIKIQKLDVQQWK